MQRDHIMKEIILDDELINDYEFGMRVYLTGIIEDMQDFSGKQSLIFFRSHCNTSDALFKNCTGSVLF